jgi:hypothetical protein
MVNQVIDLGGGDGQYSEFLGLQNTKVGQWFNRTFPTKKKYDEAVAKGKLYDAQNSQFGNQGVNNTTPGNDSSGIPRATWEVIGIPQYEYDNVVAQPTSGNNSNSSSGQQSEKFDATEVSGVTALGLGGAKSGNGWMWWLGGAVIVAGVAVFIIKRNNKN